MKRFASYAALAVALCFMATQARAGLLVNVNFDEFGNGLTDYPATTLHALPVGLVADPSGGLGVPVLVYVLPFTPIQGDVQLQEFAGVAIFSDVVRFFNQFMIFYSDNGDGVDAIADAGLPGPLSTNVVTILEVGPEGNNGAIYTPTANQPGYINSDFSATYNITSDSAVPEPGIVSLMAAGLAGLGLLKRYCKR